MTSVDEVETNTAFAEEHEANFPILSAPDKTMPEAYGVLNERGMCNRWTYYIGTDGTVLKIDKETSPPTAGADLARTMAELEFPRK